MLWIVLIDAEPRHDLSHFVMDCFPSLFRKTTHGLAGSVKKLRHMNHCDVQLPAYSQGNICIHILIMLLGFEKGVFELAEEPRIFGIKRAAEAAADNWSERAEEIDERETR